VRTAQQIAASPVVVDADALGQPESYLIFKKMSHRGYHTLVGEVEARSGAQALAAALQRFSDPPALVWWLVPERAVTRSQPEDIERLFQHAETRFYRDEGHYHTLATLRKIKAGSEAKAKTRR
jgi:1,2-phenylacetyl-CoA epoxidase PaaB subunit